jgi:hypothetical protein
MSAGIRVQNLCEDGSRIEVGQTTPVDAAVLVDQRGTLTISNNSVVQIIHNIV